MEKQETFFEKIDRIGPLVNNILIKEKHFFFNVDEYINKGDNYFFTACSDLTEGILELEKVNVIVEEKDKWDRIINRTLKIDFIINYLDNSKAEVTYKNHGRGINISESANALNQILSEIGFTGKKYFCDISWDPSALVMAFIEFPVEFELVNLLNLFRGFGEQAPHAYGYYYQKQKEYKNLMKK